MWESEEEERKLLRRSQGLQLEVGRVGGDGQDAKGVGVSQTTLPALDCDDSGPRSDQVQRQSIAETEADTVIDLNSNRLTMQMIVYDDVTYVDLPLVGLDTPGFGIPEGVAATVQVDLPGGLLVTSDCKKR